MVCANFWLQGGGKSRVWTFGTNWIEMNLPLPVKEIYEKKIYFYQLAPSIQLQGQWNQQPNGVILQKFFSDMHLTVLGLFNVVLVDWKWRGWMTKGLFLIYEIFNFSSHPYFIQSASYAFVFYLCGYNPDIRSQNSSFPLKLKYFSGGM